MNENPAQNQPYQKILGRKEGSRELGCLPLTSVPQDDFYERRIFELESRINHLEYLLMVTEQERNKYKRQACA